MASHTPLPSSEEKSSKNSSFMEFWNTSKTLFLAFLVAVLLRSFLFEPFNIPSTSMVPNLLVGDFLFVSKWPFGYSRYSFPFGFNIFQGRILDLAMPKQGDVIVFKYPQDTDTQWIKRVIGTPGDTIQMVEGILHINGTPVELQEMGEYTYVEEEDSTLHITREYKETLPNGESHTIIKEIPFGEARLDNTPAYKVPQGHYFVMGDNRDHSGDSRTMTQLKFVPAEYILGKAALIYFSTEHSYWPQSTLRTPMNWFSIGDWFSKKFIWWQPWKWFTSIRYSRLFKMIH